MFLMGGQVSDIMSATGNEEQLTTEGHPCREPDPGDRKRPAIVVVGVCGSGKSLLSEKLQAAGYAARPVAQEHSLVPDLFRKKAPDIVIFLEARDDTVARRKSSGWKPGQLRAQRQRLKLAREKADIVLETDEANPDSLLAAVLRELEQGF
jgi:hypothetical protein